MFTIAHMTIGGAQRVTFNLIKWLKENTDSSVHLIIYSKRSVGNVAYDLNDISHSYASGGFFRTVRTIRKQLKQLKPDILVTMGTPAAIFDVPACIGLGIKHIISERNDPAHFAGSAKTRIISRLLMRKADGFIFQTKDAQQYYGGTVAKRSVVIPNPLFNTNLMPAAKYSGNDTKKVVSVGRLHKQKNHQLLIRAFKHVLERHPDYKLIIYGEGKERCNNESLIEAMQLKDKVLLPGGTDRVFEAIYSASLFVLSSDFEGMPNALMEAMALGLPCISTDCPCGGPKELIKHEENGMLVSVNDKVALYEAMIYMIEHPTEAKEMGHKAMQIREKLNLNTIAKEWYHFFQSVNNIL